MGVQEAPYSLRLEHEVMQKIRVLAAKERRSINMQLCIAVESYLNSILTAFNYHNLHME